MKKLLLLLLFIAPAAWAQIANDNTATVLVDGAELKTQPRRITIAGYTWVTANTVNPDKSLRIWLGSYDGKDITQPGTYVVIDFDGRADKKYATAEYAKYKGIAAIKYVEETKKPRMEYHVGKSENNLETIEVRQGKDGFLEIELGNYTLAGTFWKEKATATIFGGVDRLVDKLENKATTAATGYDSDIDPEGRGYKRTDKKDSIKLSNGKIRLKM